MSSSSGDRRVTSIPRDQSLDDQASRVEACGTHELARMSTVESRIRAILRPPALQVGREPDGVWLTVPERHSRVCNRALAFLIVAFRRLRRIRQGMGMRTV